MKEEPIITITKPKEEKIIVDGSGIIATVYNYDNSHVIFKGVDLGTFLELVEMKKENQDLKKTKNRAINFCNYLLENNEVVINGVKYYKQESDDIITRAILEKLEVE